MFSSSINRRQCLVAGIGCLVSSFLNPVSAFATHEKVQTFKGYHSWVFLPDRYGEDRVKWPLVVFLHGASHRGTNPKSYRRNIDLSAMQEFGSLPFIVVAPQCPSRKRWSPSRLDDFLDDVAIKYSIDPSRLYMTGISLGGFGTWEYACKHPDRLAAIAPVCGGGKVADIKAIKELPTWAFHGARDRVVPVRRSDELVNALKKMGGNVKYTRYSKSSHNIWSSVYCKADLYQWFLQHVR